MGLENIKLTRRQFLELSSLVAIGAIINPSEVAAAAIGKELDYDDAVVRARRNSLLVGGGRKAQVPEFVATPVIYPDKKGFPDKLPAPFGGEFTSADLTVLNPQWEKQYEIYKQFLEDMKKRGIVNGGIKLNYGVDIVNPKKARLWGTVEDPNSPNNGAVLVPVSYGKDEYYGMGEVFKPNQEFMYLTPQTEKGSIAFANGKWVSVEMQEDGTQKVTDYVSNRFNLWVQNLEVPRIDRLSQKELIAVDKWKGEVMKKGSSKKTDFEMAELGKLGQIKRVGDTTFEVVSEVVYMEDPDEVVNGDFDKARVVLGFVGLDGKPKTLAFQFGRTIIPNLRDERGASTEDAESLKRGGERRFVYEQFTKKVEKFNKTGKRMPIVFEINTGGVETWTYGDTGIDTRFEGVKESVLATKKRAGDFLSKGGIPYGALISPDSVNQMRQFVEKYCTGNEIEQTLLAWKGYYEKIAALYWRGKYPEDKIVELIRDGIGDRTPDIMAMQILKMIAGSDPKDDLWVGCSGVRTMYLPKGQ